MTPTSQARALKFSRRTVALWALQIAVLPASAYAASALTAPGTARWHLARFAVITAAVLPTYAAGRWPPGSRIDRVGAVVGRRGAALVAAASAAAALFVMETLLDAL